MGFITRLASLRGILLILVFVLVLTLPALAHGYPKYWAQNGGTAPSGNEWWPGVPPGKQADIAADGCGITSAAMVLYPRSAEILDERTGQTDTVAADPYVVYRTNGDSTYTDWLKIGNAFGVGEPERIVLEGKSVKTKALTIAAYLNNGYFPIAYLSQGHFIVFVDHTIEPSPMEVDLAMLKGTSVQVDEDITPVTDELCTITSLPSGPYDDKFIIHDPAYGTSLGGPAIVSSTIIGALRWMTS